MRNLILSTFLVLITYSAEAQDINTLLQQTLGNQGVKMEPDNDPFRPNAFIGSFRMEVHAYDAEGKELQTPTDIRYWSSADMTLIQASVPDSKRKEDMKMLSDLKGKWQYMLMSDGTTRTAMKSRKMKITLADTTKIELSAQDVRITTETRVIDGHPCRKVVVTNEEGTWTGWMAEDLPTPFADMAANTSAPDQDLARRMADVKGFPMEYEWTETSSGQRVQCFMKDLRAGAVDPSVFSLDGYSVLELPVFGR